MIIHSELDKFFLYFLENHIKYQVMMLRNWWQSFDFATFFCHFKCYFSTYIYCFVKNDIMQRPFNMFIYCSKYQPLFITKTRRCKASIPCVQYLRYQQRNKFCISLLLGICSHIHINAHFLNNRFICICNPPPNQKKNQTNKNPKEKQNEKTPEK